MERTVKRRVLGNDPFEKGAAERAPVAAPKEPASKRAAVKPKKGAKRAEALPDTPELQLPKRQKQAVAEAAPTPPPVPPSKPAAAPRPPAKPAPKRPPREPPALVTTFPRASPLRPVLAPRPPPPDADGPPEPPVRASPLRPVVRHTAPPPGPRASPAPPPRYEEPTVSRESPLPQEQATVPYAAALHEAPTPPPMPPPAPAPAWEVPTGGSAVRAVVGGLWQATRALLAPAAAGGWGRDEGLARALHPLGVLLFERYWRVQVDGAELVPDGPCLLVANHSGALPLGGPVLALALERHRPELERVRWALEEEVLRTPVGALGRRLGAVEQTRENVLALLAERRPVAVFPEGPAGLERSFLGQRQLRSFERTDYVAIAATAQVPIVPVAIAGGERAFPYLGALPLGERQVPLTVPPLPVQWRVRFGRPLAFPGIAAARADDPAFLAQQNAAVRDAITAMLHELWAG